jgi:hypothetical protein
MEIPPSFILDLKINSINVSMKGVDGFESLTYFSSGS